MEISGIDGLIEYVDDLSLKCGWSSEDRDSALSGLKQIRDRMVDPRLYLGVVGEFSSGKSTFINALLGVELLKEDVLQGTTCAPTFIAAGNEFEVEVVFTDGTVLKYSETVKWHLRLLRKVARYLGYKRSLKKDVLSARDFIVRYTASEEYSCRVERVALTLPIKMPFFTENVVLVDTPGVNAENGRHQDVTESAMRRYCDLVVALTVAPTPCPQSLMTFLRQNEAAVKDRCIGLITQIDRVRKAERSRQIRYIQDRFNTEGIGLLALHAAAPYYVVHPEDADTEDKTVCRDQFSEIAAKILSQLAENKDAMIAKRTRELLECVINDHVIPVVQNAEAEAGQKIEQYESVRLLTYEDFRNKWLKSCRRSLSGFRMQSVTIRQFARSVAGRFAEDLRTKIKSAQSCSEMLRAYVKGFSANSIKSRIDPLIQDKFGKWSSGNAQLRDRCLADISDALFSYGIDGGIGKIDRDKKRPVYVVPCGVAICAKAFLWKYWLYMIVSGIVLLLMASAIVGIACGSGCLWVLLALIVVLGLGFFVINVDRWRAKTLSSLAKAQDRLFSGLHESLRSFVLEVYEFDFKVIEDGIANLEKYKREMLAKVEEKTRNVRREQDKVSLAREALPVLKKSLEALKSVLAQSARQIVG